MEIRTILITQARTGSTRLPGKVLKKIQGKTLLQIHLDRIKQSKLVRDIIVATTINTEDDVIYSQVKEWGFHSFRGSVDDVLDRYYQAARSFKPDWVVRVTSDCPLLDPKLIDDVILFAQVNKVDYVSNTLIEHFPDGQDIEVFKFSALEKAWKEAVKGSEREHVTPYIKNNSNDLGTCEFKAMNYPSPADFSKVRMTVDEQADFDVIEILVSKLGLNQPWVEYTNYMIQEGLGSMNQNIIRNEGLLKSIKNDV